jgi:type II secretory pathway pseudopilin PulG
MEHKITKNQHGYLLIVVSILIVIIGLVSVMLVNMYLGAMRSTTNILQADQALYIAKAGLEMAKRDLLKNNATMTCEAISTRYTEFKYPSEKSNPPGIFSIKGTEKNWLTTLSFSINEKVTELDVRDTSGLLPAGIIMIDSEFIWYSKIAGTWLLELKRGIFNTTAVGHNTGALVTQNACSLISEAGVPNLNQPEGKRVLQEILWKKANDSADGTIYGVKPTLVAAKSVKMIGNTSIHNFKYLNLNAIPFGANIICGKDVSISSNASTKIGPSGNEQVASTAKTNPYKTDVCQGTGIVSDDLWKAFFDKSKADLKNELMAEGRVINSCNYDFVNVSGKIWINCSNFRPLGPIGTEDNKVTLIVDGDFESPNGFTSYGILYITGDLELNAAKVYGQIAVEGNVDLKGNTDIYYADTFLSGYSNSIISEAYN